jgi:hypothetical protein
MVLYSLPFDNSIQGPCTADNSAFTHFGRRGSIKPRCSNNGPHTSVNCFPSYLILTAPDVLRLLAYPVNGLSIPPTASAQHQSPGDSGPSTASQMAGYCTCGNTRAPNGRDACIKLIQVNNISWRCLTRHMYHDRNGVRLFLSRATRAASVPGGERIKEHWSFVHSPFSSLCSIYSKRYHISSICASSS